MGMLPLLLNILWVVFGGRTATGGAVTQAMQS